MALFPCQGEEDEWVNIILLALCFRRRRWIFGFADLAKFWFSFFIFAIKNCGFWVLVSSAVCGFSPGKSLISGFCQQLCWFFIFFSLMQLIFFLVLPRKITIILKLYFQETPYIAFYPNFLLEGYMTSLVFSAAIICEAHVTAAKQTMKS